MAGHTARLEQANNSSFSAVTCPAIILSYANEKRGRKNNQIVSERADRQQNSNAAWSPKTNRNKIPQKGGC